MSAVVHKVDVPIGGRGLIHGRFLACAIAVHTTPGHVSCWYELAYGKPSTRQVAVIATGTPYVGEHLGTAVDPGAPLVWHVVVDASPGSTP